MGDESTQQPEVTFRGGGEIPVKVTISVDTSNDPAAQKRRILEVIVLALLAFATIVLTALSGSLISKNVDLLGEAKTLERDAERIRKEADADVEESRDQFRQIESALQAKMKQLESQRRDYDRQLGQRKVKLEHDSKRYNDLMKGDIEEQQLSKIRDERQRIESELKETDQKLASRALLENLVFIASASPTGRRTPLGKAISEYQIYLRGADDRPDAASQVKSVIYDYLAADGTLDPYDGESADASDGFKSSYLGHGSSAVKVKIEFKDGKIVQGKLNMPVAISTRKGIRLSELQNLTIVPSSE
ncbi:MAG: hypothetical protein M3552_20785 [Planctomycetota bacterium]|nr:hypothetical protein [Planctomycetota bacterium]